MHRLGKSGEIKGRILPSSGTYYWLHKKIKELERACPVICGSKSVLKIRYFDDFLTCFYSVKVFPNLKFFFYIRQRAVS